MREVAAELDIASYSTHTPNTGHLYLVEINVLVGENFALQKTPEIDALLARILDAIGLPFEHAWRGILFTTDPRRS